MVADTCVQGDVAHVVVVRREQPVHHQLEVGRAMQLRIEAAGIFGGNVILPARGLKPWGAGIEA